MDIVKKLKQTEYGIRVDVSLYDMNTKPDIFWSPRKFRIENGRQEPAGGCNSYVLVEETDPAPGINELLFEGKRVRLYSINGAGEVRWEVFARELRNGMAYEREGKLDPHWDCAEFLLAARHFNLKWHDVDTL